VNATLTFAQIDPDALEQVGGKGLSLARLAAAGLPVPAGFCIPVAAYHAFQSAQSGDPATIDAIWQAIGQAYEALGGGLVAVRSSATAEDAADTSFAGQQVTILGVEGQAALIEAVQRCWESLRSARATAYRQRQGVDERSLGMAVVVQRLIPAEVAGVLFTRDPLEPSASRMVVEASWGLGEAVVSGAVMPDRFVLDREPVAVRQRHLGSKAITITAAGRQPTPPQRQEQFCLTDEQLYQLADLGLRVEAFFGQPRDIEWAIAAGQLWLLQARPITTAKAPANQPAAAAAALSEQLRQREIARLARLADPKGTVWSRFNLSESLPAPTPMTWALIRRHLSGRGATGMMFRDFGLVPDPALADECTYDLVCGRPYCNLSREPRMTARYVPQEHSFAKLKQNPALALYPQSQFAPLRDGLATLLALPLNLFRLIRASLRINRLSERFADYFRNECIPRFTAEVDAANRIPPANLNQRELLERFEMWTWRVLVDFGRESLKPTVFAETAYQNLAHALHRRLGDERTRAALGELLRGVRPDPEADFAQALVQLSAGSLTEAEFLARFGHRGSGELELARPRWAEGGFVPPRLAHQPAEPVDPSTLWQAVAQEARFNEFQEQTYRVQFDRLRTYVGLRETAKHHFMRGYAYLRRLLVEMDRRFHLDGGIFYLLPEELPQLFAGADLRALIDQRRAERDALLRLPVPDVLFSDDLDAIGRLPPVGTGTTSSPNGTASTVSTGTATTGGGQVLQGVGLSAGVAEGPAWVLTEPNHAGSADQPDQPYILVCPSTDPDWVPLFVRAAGLVMETGGVLSHGAIVAREFGLPAVAGLTGVTRQIRTGQRLRLDGATGRVEVL